MSRSPGSFTTEYAFGATIRDARARPPTGRDPILVEGVDVRLSVPTNRAVERFLLECRCTAEQARQLDEMTWVDIEGVVLVSPHQTFSSSNGQIVYLNRPTPAHSDDGRGYNIQIELTSFTDTLHESVSNPDERSVAFGLAGPDHFWPLPPGREWRFSDEHHRVRLDVGDRFPCGSVYALWVPIRASIRHEGREVEATDWRCRLEFVPNSAVHISDADLLENARSLVRDLVLIASLASRGVINWYKYAITGEHFVFFQRGMTVDDHADPRAPIHPLFPFNGIEALLPTAAVGLSSLRSAGIDPRRPIQTLAYAHQIPIPEHRFSSYFQALEQFKDIFAQARDLEYILPSSQRRKLASAIRDTIRDQSALSEDKIAAVTRKVPELERRSIGEVLNEMRREYRVQAADLYPEGEKETFLTTRNLLTHTAKPTALEHLMLEQIRVLTLVERLILSALGVDEKFIARDLPPREWRSVLRRKPSPSADEDD